MLNDEYLQEVIATAERQTESIEQRTIHLLHERGDMTNYNCDGQRAIEARVRTLLLQ